MASDSDNIKFPVYRKYPHNRTFFKVLSSEEFEELSIVGETFTVQHFKAKIFPDKVFLHDLAFNMQSHWEQIESHDYEEMKSFCTQYLKEMPV